MSQDDPTGISPTSAEKKPKGRVKKEKAEKPEKAEKTEKAEKGSDGLKQTKLAFKKEPKKVCLNNWVKDYFGYLFSFSTKKEAK